MTKLAYEASVWLCFSIIGLSTALTCAKAKKANTTTSARKKPLNNIVHLLGCNPVNPQARNWSRLTNWCIVSKNPLPVKIFCNSTPVEWHPEVAMGQPPTLVVSKETYKNTPFLKKGAEQVFLGGFQATLIDYHVWVHKNCYSRNVADHVFYSTLPYIGYGWRFVRN